MNWRELADSREDPLFDFMWDIQILAPGGARFAPEYVENFDVPLPKFEAGSATFQARKYYFAEFEDFGTATLTFYEDVRCTIWRNLRTWQKKIKTEDGNYNVPAEYKGTIHGIIHDPHVNTRVRFQLNGTFPTIVPNLPLGNTGVMLKHQIEFAVDSVKAEFL